MVYTRGDLSLSLTRYLFRLLIYEIPESKSAVWIIFHARQQFSKRERRPMIGLRCINDSTERREAGPWFLR